MSGEGVDAALVAERLAGVRSRLEAAGGGDVRIVAVTKGFGPDAVEAAVAAGLDDIGENYAQECVAKLEAAHPIRRPRVHFIGRLQRNKVRRLAGVVDVWQTIDRPELGRELARRAPGARVLVEVNISGEAAKGGVEPAAAPRLVGELGELGLDVVGLMGIGPLAEPEAARPGFRLLRGLVDELGLAECSMGMSADLEVAVQEGSTMVRIGRALFGERPPRPGGG
ncbi:MAG: YggS family pyridoxal phosphate-dependent enzyme [Actinomyces sp.]|nr:MAG: YggS family pyridoxal phosphate-dependent enzyme [Actinomyces sp.]